MVILKKIVKQNWMFILFLSMGILVRALFIGNIPGGINQDEAYAGYEAYSLIHYGVDSFGYSFPCYFVSWGSGMNVLESYLAIPFVWLFGLNSITIRLPQLVVGCISLPIVYLLLKDLFDRKVALCGMGFLAICPWHIMLSRWGLESNLAPGFLLFGLYFLMKGLENNRYLLLAAIMYGLSLYAYAITWMVVPITLVAFGVFFLITKHKFSIGWVSVSVVTLAALALPLILFLLVNNDLIPEIRTFFFSVPKLVMMRDSEIVVKRLWAERAYLAVIQLIVTQSDKLIWNTPEYFGIFYIWTLPLTIIGGIRMLKLSFFSRDEKSNKRILICLGMFCAFEVSVMLKSINVNKINALHMYIVFLIAIGIERVITWLKNIKIAKCIFIVCFVISFASFCIYYFGAYNKKVSPHFNEGVKGALEYVDELKADEVMVDPIILHPSILFYEKTPVTTYLETVEYMNYPAEFLQLSRFDKFNFQLDYAQLDESAIYMAPIDKQDIYKEAGFEIHQFGYFIVAHQ